MNLFEKELRNIIAHSWTAKDPHYIGKICYIQLDKDLRARMEFIYENIHEHYDALKITVLNRTVGPVDTVTIAFEDVLRKWFKEKEYPPRIGRCGPYEEYSWYYLEPDDEVYKALAAQMDEYLSVFHS